MMFTINGEVYIIENNEYKKYFYDNGIVYEENANKANPTPFHYKINNNKLILIPVDISFVENKAIITESMETYELIKKQNTSPGKRKGGTQR